MWSLGSNSADHKSLTNIVTGCSTSRHADNIFYDTNTWIQLQEAYYAVKIRHDEYWHEENDYSTPHTGMQVPFEVRINPKNGLRQVMVMRDIPAGYTIWEPIHYETFETEHEYVEFLQELPHDLQCETLSWSHPSWYNKELYVDITLDEGTFIQESSSPRDINLDIDCVALRDIKAGEFVYMNHTDVLPPQIDSLHYAESGIEWFDDIRSTAWKRSGLGMGRPNHPTHATGTNHLHPTGVIEPPSIASGVAVLSTLYLVAKAMRANQKSSRYHQSKYRHDDNAYGASFFYQSKRKMA